MAEQLPKAAAASLKKLSVIADKISGLLEKDEVFKTEDLAQQAADLLKVLPKQLENPNQKRVVKHLMVPWVNKLVADIKAHKADESTYAFYYGEKNVILKALIKLSKGSADAKTGKKSKSIFLLT